VRVLVLLVLSACALPACRGCTTTHFREVPVGGMPGCPPTPANPSRKLLRSIVVELGGGDTQVRRVFDGWSGRTAPRTLSLPEGRRTWTARFGQCAPAPAAGRRCSRVDWYAKRTLDIDPAASGVSIVVPAPPSSSCEDAAPRADR